MRRLLITAVAFGLSQYPQICAAEPIDAGEWLQPSSIKSKSNAIDPQRPSYPVRLKWVAEIIPADSNKLQVIVQSKDGTYIDLIYHYDRKPKTRIPTSEITEWGITSNGSVGPGPMDGIAIPLSLLLGSAGERQVFSIYISFLDADLKPFSIVFDPYDNGKLLSSLLRYSTGLEPSEKRSDEYIEIIKKRRLRP